MASCKWRDAQRAMRNRQYIGYTLGPLIGTQFYNKPVRWRQFDSEGGLSDFVWTDYLFIIIYFHVAWDRENLFLCKHSKPQSRLRNSNVIESSTFVV